MVNDGAVVKYKRNMSVQCVGGGMIHYVKGVIMNLAER